MLPSKTAVIEKLKKLITGEVSREQASAWACQWIIDGEAQKMDRKTWEALINLGAADLIAVDRPYLYEKTDFEKWLAELEQAGG